MSRPTLPSYSSFLAPSYWPTWLGIGLLALIAFLPLRLRLACGSVLGRLLFIFARERRYITATNIDLCFPELSKTARQDIVLECFIENGRGLIETGTAWVRPPKQFRHLLRLINVEAMQQALAKGKGVILLGAHYSTLDFSANLLSTVIPFAATYRPHNNPLFDAFMLRGRIQNCHGVIDRYDIRGTLRHLKQNAVVWYAPDQDYGPAHAVYAPFFGRQAATITAASRLARIYHSPVILVRHHRVQGPQPYEIEFIPFPETFPGDDDVADATFLNQQLEKAIRVQPAQYLWMHKRFKTQPGGKPESPYINIRAPQQKIDRAAFNRMIEGSKVIEEQHVKNLTRLLHNNALFRILPTSSPRFFEKPPMQLFEKNARLLRLKGIPAITIDNIFRIRKADFVAASYFPLPGSALSLFKNTELPIEPLAVFLAKVHQEGFFFRFVRTSKIFYHEGAFAIANPEDIQVFPTSICYLDRFDNVQKLLNKLELKQNERNQFIENYTEAANLTDVTEFTQLFSLLQALR